MRIGTCSWKYDSWRGLIYPEKGKINYLKEYAKNYNNVEIDQWFWSLFGIDKIKLPDQKIVEEYVSSVNKDFKFSIKVPNSITLTHFYKYTTGIDSKNGIRKNPHFLSIELFEKFLKSLEKMKDNIGVLLFQFEYLNKEKMSSLNEFLDRLEHFFLRSNRTYPIALELRNPNFLKEEYFKFINSMGLSHVFIQGYYMPDIVDIYKQFSKNIIDLAVIRLLGPDRKGIEKETGKEWNKIVFPKDSEIIRIVEMLKDLEKRKIIYILNVNNHYEGSAPKTIERLKEFLK